MAAPRMTRIALPRLLLLIVCLSFISARAQQIDALVAPPPAPGAADHVAVDVAAAASAPDLSVTTMTPPEVLSLPAVELSAGAVAVAATSSVQNAKREALAALHNPETAWNAYVAAADVTIRATMSADAKLPPTLATLAVDSDAVARARRFSIFKANLGKIVALNRKAGASLAYGINNFTHLTTEEFEAAYLTPSLASLPKAPLPMPSNNNRKLLQSSSACGALRSFPFSWVSPPASVDWRAGYVTDARYQGKCGSCAAFATVAAAEAAFIAKWGATKNYRPGNTDLSEQMLLDCTRGQQCDGAWPHHYLDHLACKGTLSEAAAPYRAADSDACPGGARWTSGVAGWAYVPIGSERGFAQALTHAPITITVNAGSDAFRFYKTGVFDCSSGAPAQSHAITLVAYSDAVRMANGAMWRVWTAKNSWGAGWGASGFVSLRKDCPAPGALGAYQYGVLPIRG